MDIAVFVSAHGEWERRFGPICRVIVHVICQRKRREEKRGRGREEKRGREGNEVERVGQRGGREKGKGEERGKGGEGKEKGEEERR